MHGHSYEVTAWFPAADARPLQAELNRVLKFFDHDELLDELAWGEGLAEEVGNLLPGCIEVEISRPLERIYARWFASADTRPKDEDPAQTGASLASGAVGEAETPNNRPNTSSHQAQKEGGR